MKDQLYLLKQSIGNPKTPECNCNSKSDSYITSLIEQIHDLKEENKMKNSFIQTLLSQNSSTTFPSDLFRYNDKVDETSPASKNDHVSDDGHVSDDIDGTKDEDINDEDKNLDEKNITIMKNKKRKTKNTNNRYAPLKNIDESFNSSSKDNLLQSEVNVATQDQISYNGRKQERKKALKIGDSMVKGIKIWKINKKLKFTNASVNCFPGANTSDMKHYIKPPIKKSPNAEVVITGLLLTTYSVRYPHAVPFLRNKITIFCKNHQNDIPFREI